MKLISGGRMNTVDVRGDGGEKGGVLELGAQWIHGGCQARTDIGFIYV